MELFQDVIAFSVAVLTQWVASVGGILAVVFDFYLRATGKELPKRLYVRIFGGLFLLPAFFLAWQEQHRLVLTLREPPGVEIVDWDPVISPGQDWRLTVRDRKKPGVEVRVALVGGTKLRVKMQNEAGNDRSAEERTVRIDCDADSLGLGRRSSC